MPPDWLLWLALSPVRLFFYRLQWLHAPMRLLHLAGMAAFFGSILVLDLRLLGLVRAVPMQGMSRLVLPCTVVGFAVAMLTGVALFLFDPIQTGSHTWFVPKLALIGLGMVNVLVFHRRGFAPALAAAAPTRHGRLAGILSLLLWFGVIACATGNQVERPLLTGRTRSLPR